MLHIIEEKESQVGDSFDRYLLGFEILVFKERKSEQKNLRQRLSTLLFSKIIEKLYLFNNIN